MNTKLLAVNMKCLIIASLFFLSACSNTTAPQSTNSPYIGTWECSYGFWWGYPLTFNFTSTTAAIINENGKTVVADSVLFSNDSGFTAPNGVIEPFVDHEILVEWWSSSQEFVYQRCEMYGMFDGDSLLATVVNEGAYLGDPNVYTIH